MTHHVLFELQCAPARACRSPVSDESSLTGLLAGLRGCAELRGASECNVDRSLQLRRARDDVAEDHERRGLQAARDTGDRAERADTRLRVRKRETGDDGRRL